MLLTQTNNKINLVGVSIRKNVERLLLRGGRKRVRKMEEGIEIMTTPSANVR
jgi:hypothetical protein